MHPVCFLIQKGQDVQPALGLILETTQAHHTHTHTREGRGSTRAPQPGGCP